MVHQFLDVAQTFYYGLWANLRELPLLYRAAIVVLAAVCLAWLAARPILLKLLSRLLRLLALGVKGLCLWGELLLSPLSRRSPDRYVQLCNRWNGAMGQWHTRLTQWAKQVSQVEPHIGRAVALYLALMVLICLPTWVRPFVSGQYIPYLSFAAQAYQQLEAPALQAAAAYEPLILLEPRQSPSQEELESEPPESPPQEVWLSLSSQGRRGTNVREGPGKGYSVLTVISGGEEVLYLGDQSDGWVHICLSDGREGWIYHNLLSPLPQEEDTP